MKTKIVSILTIAIIMLGFLAAIPMRASATLPTSLYVYPSTVDLVKSSSPVGTTFTVQVKANVVSPDTFFGWEFELTWTPGVIDCTLETLNTAIWGAGNYLGPWVSPSIDNVAGVYHQSLTGKSPGVPVSGDIVLVELTFEVVELPPFGETVSTPLHLQIAPGYIAYCLLDGSSNEIEHSFNDGAYSYYNDEIPGLPYLEVVPASNIFSGKNIYKTPFSFDVNVNVRSVEADYNMAGVEFLLFYNTTVLDINSVTPGTFFEAFTTATWFYSIDDTLGKLRVVYTILDIPGMTPPYGDGSIATITFQATLQEQFPTFVWSDLDLQVDFENGMTSYFVDKFAEEFGYREALDGYYQLNGYVIGRVIDLYTQYPDPYGGQGPMAPSDMFWPQKEVELYANVTYNEWPVQNKLVGFEVRGPNGELVDILQAMSDVNGVAHTTYRIPWPCDDPESWFGVWTVTSTVDIACIVVNDTLQFHFDYLVHWYGGGDYKVTTDKEAYGHCEYINVTVTFGSHSQQNRWVLLTVSIHDELNYPFGTNYVWVEVGGTVFCQLKNYTATLPVHVVKWAAAGTATIYVNAYSDWPSNGGSPWAPTFKNPDDTYPTVNILAIWA